MSNTKSGHLAGGKFTTSHSTIIEAAEIPLRAVARLSCVQKISLGIIKPVRTGTVSVKFIAESACVLVKIRGRTAIQEIRIYSSNAEQVKAVITANCI